MFWLRRLLERIDSWFDVDLGHLDDEPVRAALSHELDDLGGMG